MGRLLVLFSFAAGSVAAMAAADSAPFVFHLDFNVSALNRDAIVRTLDHVARQGCNAILWEIENAVKFDCCPEVASPDAFTKDEFRGILAHAAKLGLEPIPLMQTFGHGEYVLAHDRFKPLRERPDRKDCYCSSNPEARKFLKTLLHEYLDLFGAGVRRFHLGGDEAWVYRSCAKCKARKPAELYFEHLEAVSAELRAKGVRPGVWHDMLRRFDETGAVYADLPKDFAIWYWDYGTFENGAWARGHEAALRRERANGREVIYCGSIRSFIDSPFFVRYGFHRANLAESISWCRKEKLSGYCVTSWAIHQGPLELQRPLIDFAAKRWLDPGVDADADWRGIVARHFGVGVTAEDLDALTDWNMGLFGADARFGTYKDGALPPPGGIAGRVAKWGAGEAEKTAAVVRALSEKAAKPAAALRRARAANASPFVGLALEAAELKIAYQNMMADALSGTNDAAAAFPRERALRFYRRELGERSAWRCVERICRLYEGEK